MSKVGQWLQVGANVGIIFGLILVILQMNQNADLLETQLVYLESERQLNLEAAVLGENSAVALMKAADDFESLTRPEQRVVEGYYFYQIEQWRASYRLYELGLLPARNWKDRASMDATYLFSSPYGQAYWELTKITMPTEVVEHVDHILENPREGYLGVGEYLEDIMERARQIRDDA